MKGYTFEFDISKVMFDEQYKSDEYETVTLYFFAPKEWLGGLYPEAISAEISVEYPVAHPEAIYATVMMSPTRVTDKALSRIDIYRQTKNQFSALKGLVET